MDTPRPPSFLVTGELPSVEPTQRQRQQPPNRMRLPLHVDPECVDPLAVFDRVWEEQQWLLQRTWSDDTGACDRPRCRDRGTVRLMQCNLLADGLTQTNSLLPGFRMSAEDADEVLSWRRRKWRLLALLLQHDPDILALEEMDHGEDFFRPCLAHYGYEGRCGYKWDAPSFRLGHYSDGSAVFWHRDRFELVDDYGQRLRLVLDGAVDEASPLPLVRLRDRSPNHDTGVWDVAAVHLKAKVGRKEERMRAAQIRSVLAALVAASAGDSPADQRVLLGDLNTDPFAVPDPDEPGGLIEPDCWSILQEAGWASATPVPINAAETEAWWSTNKQRGEQGPPVRHLIDYILLEAEHRLEVVRFLLPPTACGLLPCRGNPSDHIAQVVDVRLMNRRSNDEHQRAVPAAPDDPPLTL